MEECNEIWKKKFGIEWNMEWKIFSMERKKFRRMEYGKIVFHSIACPTHRSKNIAILENAFPKKLNRPISISCVCYGISYRFIESEVE